MRKARSLEQILDRSSASPSSASSSTSSTTSGTSQDPSGSSDGYGRSVWVEDGAGARRRGRYHQQLPSYCTVDRSRLRRAGRPDSALEHFSANSTLPRKKK